ncbi:putative isomerase YddE [Lacunisphaera limnophila]|uniref:Putative isomerase YddE n=1 Tax=Lacunisphaera limnophila TaxID=1838286 RepID=A0A1D8AS69_9BACT|nr:PhzF family phenazine biosynthesis protein [Lacunisphaera limnophila]AOS43741.1 putative isomerase YddE [Lacunisphaera limnophila]
MKLPLYWIDAFASQVFTGNPAAVVPLDTWLPDGLMQRIAFENGLAETAFFVPVGAGRYHLRWFTPGAEVDLCGHATVATAFTLFTALGFSGPVITFDSRSGPLPVRRLPDGKIELDFPARPALPVPPPAALVQGLGATPAYYAQAQANLAVFNTAAEVRALRPDFGALATLEQYGTIVTAPGEDCDFVSRFFAPRVGVPEDPVTGSAHCVLTPYWAARLGKTKLHARQLSARGGELWCEQAGDRVKIAGHAVLYLKGEIAV